DGRDDQDEGQRVDHDDHADGGKTDGRGPSLAEFDRGDDERDGSGDCQQNDEEGSHGGAARVERIAAPARPGAEEEDDGEDKLEHRELRWTEAKQVLMAGTWSDP